MLVVEVVGVERGNGDGDGEDCGTGAGPGSFMAGS